jgi:multiple sugar transport system substrate-binding protein
MFRMGRCAMIADYPGTARLLKDPSFSAVAAWHSVALMPSGPEGRRASWTGCPVYAIPASCPDPEAAAKLLLLLASRENQVAEAKFGAIPSRRDAQEEVEDDLRLGTIGHLRYTLAQQTLRLAMLTAPRVPQYYEIEERLWPLLQQAITGDREVTEALDLGQKAVEEALA